MAKQEQLLVRNLDPEIVAALRARASKHKRSVEAEHRALLRAVLLRPRRPTFKAMLLAIPKHDGNEGEDDFAFSRGELRDVDL